MDNVLKYWANLPDDEAEDFALQLDERHAELLAQISKLGGENDKFMAVKLLRAAYLINEKELGKLPREEPVYAEPQVLDIDVVHEAPSPKKFNYSDMLAGSKVPFAFFALGVMAFIILALALRS